MDALVKAEQEDQARAQAESARSRRTLLLAGAAVIALGVVIWGVQWWTVGRFIESTDDAYLKADSMTVAPKISGYVAEVYVTDNQTVAAGQELVRLDGRQYQ